MRSHDLQNNWARPIHLRPSYRPERRGTGAARRRPHHGERKPGFPCRIELDDAAAGETLLLLNHVSHDAGNPYRESHAIFVSECATEAAVFEDKVPPALERRILSLRAFDNDGMVTDAALAQPGEANAVIRRLLADPAVDHVDPHNAIRGCFAAGLIAPRSPW